MPVEHTPPSSYILRDIQEVVVPGSVSWVPQTAGWKVLAGVLVVVLFYAVYRYALYRWNNRYRGEALIALSQLDPMNKQSAKRTFEIVKTVLRYLDSRYAKSFGQDFLLLLDGTLTPKHQPMFNDECAKQWVASLTNPNVTLTFEQRSEIIKKASDWVRLHKFHKLRKFHKQYKQDKQRDQQESKRV